MLDANPNPNDNPVDNPIDHDHNASPWDFTCTYSPQDNKLRLKPRTDERLPGTLYQRLRAAGFIWAPQQRLYVAPMWTPEREDLALELAGQIEDEGSTLAERAQDRAERFGVYQEHRGDEAQHALADVQNHGGVVAHRTQHQAERAAKKLEAQLQKAVNLWDTAQYWQRRAQGALLHAAYKERADVRHRRIRTIRTEQRRFQKSCTQALKYVQAYTDSQALTHRLSDGRLLVPTMLASYGGGLSADERGALLRGEWSQDEALAVARAHWQARVVQLGRWVAHGEHRIAYESAMLREAGGLASERWTIEVGGKVLAQNRWAVVVRINRSEGSVVSLSVAAPTERNPQRTSVWPIESVQDYQAACADAVAQVQAARKRPPLVNVQSQRCLTMTAAQWKSNTCYKGTYYVRNMPASEQQGAHRQRIQRRGFMGGDVTPIFISDAKVVQVPPAPSTPAPSLPQPTMEPCARVVSADVLPDTPTYTPPEPTAFDALKDQLKTGIQAVAAPQLFPTPVRLAQRMVHELDVQAGHRVLEPSAGTGRLLDAVLTAQSEVSLTAVECSAALAVALSRRYAGRARPHIDMDTDMDTDTETPTDPAAQIGVRAVQADFLQLNPARWTPRYDRILMNPPFSRGQDIVHIQHACRFLAEGGVLVALCANGPRQQAVLKPMAQGSGGWWEDLPAGSFASEGTNVNVAMLLIQA